MNVIREFSAVLRRKKMEVMYSTVVLMLVPEANVVV